MRRYPDKLTPELQHVLGRPNFWCAHYARVMRAVGVAFNGRVVTGGHRAQDYPIGASSANGWTLTRRADKRATGRLLGGLEHDGFSEVPR